jgi:SEFIR domain
MDVAGGSSPRFMISYAHEDAVHVGMVGRLADLLRAEGLDVRLDQYAAEHRQAWGWWTLDELLSADRVLVIASPTYRRRFHPRHTPDETGAGRGVQFEAYLITEEIYRDPRAALDRFVPVLLPGATQDCIPTVLLPYSGTHHVVSELTPAGVAELVRHLRRPPTDPDPAPCTGSWAALQLVVSARSPHRADEAVRTLLGAGLPVEGVDFEGDTPTCARVVAPLGEVVGLLATTTRTVLAQLSRQDSSGPRTVARICAHVAADPEGAQALAAQLSRSPAAAAVHGVAGAHVVVAVSKAFLDAAATTSGLHPRRSAYRLLPETGLHEPCLFAVAGRAQAPQPPPVPAPGDGTHVTAGDHSAVIGAQTLVNTGTITNGNTYHRPVYHGTVYQAGRDLTVTVVKGGRS